MALELTPPSPPSVQSTRKNRLLLRQYSRRERIGCSTLSITLQSRSGRETFNTIPPSAEPRSTSRQPFQSPATFQLGRFCRQREELFASVNGRFSAPRRAGDARRGGLRPRH